MKIIDYITFGILFISLGLAFSGNASEIETEELNVKRIRSIDVQKSNFEPSGVVISPDNEVVVVSDNGRAMTFPMRNSSLQAYYKIEKKKDLEGVTYSPTSQLYFAIEEGKDKLWVLDEDLENVLYKSKVPRHFRGERITRKTDADGAGGLEALCLIKEDQKYFYFMAANQSRHFSGDDKSAVISFKLHKRTQNITINNYYPLEIKDISGLTKVGRRVALISDTEDKLYLFNQKMKLLQVYELPGLAQEGIAVTKDRKRIYIAEDYGEVLQIDLNSPL
jgi:DNA-binding beta-propeller fold protein YncE